jgi:hypothetical protein
VEESLGSKGIQGNSRFGVVARLSHCSAGRDDASKPSPILSFPLSRTCVSGPLGGSCPSTLPKLSPAANAKVRTKTGYVLSAASLLPPYTTFLLLVPTSDTKTATPSSQPWIQREEKAHDRTAQNYNITTLLIYRDCGIYERRDHLEYFTLNFRLQTFAP